jgi:hypothetical protein
MRSIVGSGDASMSTWRAPRPSKSSAVATVAVESAAKIGSPRTCSGKSSTRS